MEQRPNHHTRRWDVNSRGPWQGMMTICRLNWPFYAIASLAAAVCILGLMAAPLASFHWLLATGASMAVYFACGSLAVSHIVYDRSDLYRWRWLDRALGATVHDRMALCHTGFDECSTALREKFPKTQWQILDHFDPKRMTEPSIQRARQWCPPAAGTIPAPFDSWPIPSGSVNGVLGLLAIHELRSEIERSRWFSEAARCLKPEGRIILAEHTRDLANLLAFGPGFLHFHSRASWRRCWEHAGLRALDEFAVTPWVRVFIIVRS